jgi:hypothetical protein
MPSKYIRIFLLVWPCTHEQTTPILPFWGHPVRWTPILEILAHFYKTHLWGGWLGKKNPTIKSVISTHHPSIVVRSWVLTHLVKFSAGALWNIDAYRALIWEYQNLGFCKYERDFRFGNYLVRPYGHYGDHLGTTLVTSLEKQVAHEIWGRSFGNSKGKSF